MFACRIELDDGDEPLRLGEAVRAWKSAALRAGTKAGWVDAGGVVVDPATEVGASEEKLVARVDGDQLSSRPSRCRLAVENEGAPMLPVAVVRATTTRPFAPSATMYDLGARFEPFSLKQVMSFCP